MLKLKYKGLTTMEWNYRHNLSLYKKDECKSVPMLIARNTVYNISVDYTFNETNT